MPRSKWIQVIYDRYTTCRRCGARVDYNVRRGGRPPKHCKPCAKLLTRQQSMLRQRIYRRRDRQVVHNP